ncbi:MAG: hypothetical protein WKF59_25575 [Chitinophagaceae bacterium]
MSEEENIPEENLKEQPRDSNKEFECENIPQHQTIVELQPTIPTSEIKDMEVHHPHHVTHKKKWGEYLLEFFMLFLAVFLGFIAENIREKAVERHREKEYIQSLYADLKADTAFISLNYRQYIRITIKQLDTLTKIISTERFNEEANTIYRLAFVNRRVLYFQYYNRTFDQLKSSGNLRLLKDRELSDSLADYDNFIHEVVKKQEARYLQATANHVALQWEILDSRFYTSKKPGVNNLPISQPNFSKEDIPKLKRLNNLYFEKLLILPFYEEMMTELLRKANNLITLIKNKYHFE